MTKPFKSLSGRAIDTSSPEEFFSGRQFAGFVQSADIVQQVSHALPDGIVQPLARVEALDVPAALAGSRGQFSPRSSERIDAGSLTRSSAPLSERAETVRSADSGEMLNMLPCCLSCGKEVSGGHQHQVELSLTGRDNVLSIPPTIMDEGTLTITPGGSVTALIDTTGDTDTITVDLVAGQTYSVSMRGTGATPLNDSFLEIFDPSAGLVNEDDDGGNGIYSLITFTASVTGTYSIVTSSFSNPGDPGTGEYTVDVRQQGADEAGDTIGTAAALSVGTTFGFRNDGTDVDFYEITLDAGQVYSFLVAGGADYASDWQNLPPGELDTYITLRDSNGNIVASGDDIAFPDDISSGIGYLVETAGTYYLEVTVSPLAVNPQDQTGGYVIDITQTDLGDLDPLDSINWFSADNVDFVDVGGVPTAYVFFAAAGQNFGETQGDSAAPLISLGWNAVEMAAVMSALDQYEVILGVNYEITTDVNQATFRLITTEDEPYGAYFYPQDPAFGTQQGIGVFNTDNGAWGVVGQPGLQQGGVDFGVILHEFGHAHGLAHPHDNGGGSDILLGVTAAQGSFGVYDLNQGVYTVMSYNDAWQKHPDGPMPFTLANADNGWSGTLGAFDIAVLQQRYGVHAHNGGDTVYTITDVADDAFYQTIWDSGGTDEIAYGGTGNARIDLTAATLDYSPTGGGVVSFVDAPGGGIWGGYTIANGVTIENATSGDGADVLIGNGVDNLLTANGGNDILMGREGDDTLDGGDGIDTAIFGGDKADYTITDIGGGSYTVTDNNLADGDDGTDTIIGMEIVQFADDVDTLDPDPNNNVAPTLSGLIPALSFNENVVNATPQIIDPNVDFQDEDGNFDGGTLTVSGLLAEDVVAVRNQGNGIGQIGVSGANVSYNGIVIGSIAGGTGAPLTVTFNQNATALAIDALIQNLTYANTSQDPTLNRTLTLDIVDDEGASLVIVPTSEVAFVELTGAADPLAGLPNLGISPNLAFVDVDNDSDLDIVVGDDTGALRYFQNTAGTYTEQTGLDNPFDGFAEDTYAAPAAMDIDGDGDLDLIVGDYYGSLHAIQNNGNGTWTQLSGGANPFDGMATFYFSDPAALDLDGDGDIDAVTGSYGSGLYSIINDGGGSFSFVGGAGNPFEGALVGTFSSPAAGDVDGDGDDDLVVGRSDGTIATFINNGGGSFTEAAGAANPFTGIDVGSFSLPVLADIDGDGDDDLIVADSSGGDTRVFENATVVMNSPNIDITVNAQNDAPSGTNNEITISEDGSYTFAAADFGFSDLDGDAFTAVVISSLPVQGALRLNGVAVTLNQAVSVADINAGLLTFTPDANESGPNYATFGFRVRDNGGTANGGVDTDPTANVMTIGVLPDNSPPRLTDLDESVTYDENVVNTTPQILDFDVTFADPDENFDGGELAVTGVLAEDRIGVNDEGNGAGEIGVSGNTVSYGGVAIGTFSGGVGNTFTVTLNAAATSEAVEALIENLTYANDSDQPTASRTLTINVTDADGADLAFQSTFEFAGFGPFEDQTNGSGYSTPTFIDLDGDGDMDMISGAYSGAIFVYRNNGVAGFAEVPGSQNPFNGVDVGLFSSTAAVNLDADGDLDLLVGRQDGTLVSFRNNGNGTFTQLAGATGPNANPFNAVDVGTYSTPAGGDIDGDGDMDVIVGNNAGLVATFRNNGNGTFTALTGTNNPFNGIDAGSFISASLFDIDGDGDLDALLGNFGGNIVAINNGGAFTPAENSQNPFFGVSVGLGPALGFADLDGDGDLDAVAGSIYGDFLTFENTTPTSASIEVNVTAQVDVVELYDENDVLVETYSTIQRAIDAAEDGYTIRPGAGTYDEDIVVDKDVTIEGANPGDVIIAGGILIDADGVTIDTVTVTGAVSVPGGSWPAGIYVRANDFTLSNSTLAAAPGTPVNGDGNNSAILTQQVTGLNVGNNTISGYAIGAYVSGGGSIGSIHDNLFQGDGGPASGLGNGVNSETSGVLIQDNTFDGLYAGVLNLFPFGPNNIDLDDYVIGNTFTNNAAERPIQIYPTNSSLNFIGTDENEAFNADISGVTGQSFSFDGQGGDDRAFGGEEADTFTGGTGTDRLFGNGGADILTGGADNDLLTGGAGIDQALFAGSITSYTDTLIGWLVTSGEGNDVLSEVEVAVEGSGQRNLLVGATGFANLQTALNNAENGDHLQLATGTYSGTFNYDDSGLVVFGTNATINATFATATAFGITVNGGGNNDSITTGANVDTLNGGGGNDTLNAGIGADALDGGAGNDRLIGGAGSDTLVGGSDTDTADYVGNFGAVKVDLSTGTGQFNFAQGDTYNGIENIDATEFGDILIGNAGVNVIRGNGGNDTIMGGAGADQLFGGAGTDTADYRGNFGAVSVNLLTGVGLFNFAQGDTLTDFENIEGTEFGDILTGNAGVNVINGNGGNDTVSGGAGADTLGGGAGIDTLTYAGNFGGVSVDLQAGTGQFNFAHNDVLAGFENLIGTSFGDILRGDGNANQIEGGDGADQLYGRAGIDVLIGGDQNDLLAGGTGADTLNGGAGTDTADYTGEFGAVSINLATGTGLFNSAQGDTLTGIENVIGTSFGDIFEGNGLDNVFTGGAGNDTFRFASGFAHDVITDFVGNGPAAGDTVRFAAGLFTDFADMMASSAQVGSDVVITLDAANTLTLQNTTLVSLDSSDFFYTL